MKFIIGLILKPMHFLSFFKDIDNKNIRKLSRGTFQYSSAKNFTKSSSHISFLFMLKAFRVFQKRYIFWIILNNSCYSPPSAVFSHFLCEWLTDFLNLVITHKWDLNFLNISILLHNSNTSSNNVLEELSFSSTSTTIVFLGI